MKLRNNDTLNLDHLMDLYYYVITIPTGSALCERAGYIVKQGIHKDSRPSMKQDLLEAKAFVDSAKSWRK